MRRAGFVVPDSKVMGRGRAEIADAIIHLECPAEEYSSAPGQTSCASKMPAHEEVHRQAANAREQATNAEEYTLEQGMDSTGQSLGSHDVGMVMETYDAVSNPAATRRKLGEKWMKLARKAYMRSHLPGRVRRAVAKALQEYPDETTGFELREVVEKKDGVGLCGQYGVLFDKALLSQTAKQVKRRRPRRRFVLAVGRQKAMSSRKLVG